MVSAQLDNILLQGDAPAVLKLCDFGYSKDGNVESDCKTACGTPEYMAPEVLPPANPLLLLPHPSVLSCLQHLTYSDSKRNFQAGTNQERPEGMFRGVKCRPFARSPLSYCRLAAQLEKRSRKRWRMRTRG